MNTTSVEKAVNGQTWAFEQGSDSAGAYYRMTNADLARTRAEIQASIRQVAAQVDSLHSGYTVVWWVFMIALAAAIVIGSLRLLYEKGVGDGLATCKERKKVK